MYVICHTKIITNLFINANDKFTDTMQITARLRTSELRQLQTLVTIQHHADAPVINKK